MLIGVVISEIPAVS